MPTTPYTVLREYSGYISPYNIDLAKDVALYKQTKVDANRQTLNAQMDYLMGQDILKQQDREYLQNRMMDTIDRVNKIYGGADLSSDGIVRHIQGEISSVLDGRVMNAIAGTMEFRRMSGMLQELQESGDKTYSAMNAYQAMKPAYDWLNDGKTGSRLNQLTYIPYFDYNADLAAKMKNIVSSHKGTTYEIPIYDENNNPTGRMQKVTRDQMTMDQAAQYAMANLDQRALQQMQVEAMYLADSQPGAFSLEASRLYMSNVIKDANAYLNSLEAEKAGAQGDKNKLDAIENEIRSTKAAIKGYTETLGGMTPETYNPYEGALNVIQDRYRRSAAQLYSYDNSSYEMTVDQAYWNRLGENRRNAEFGWRKYYQNENLRLKRQNAGKTDGSSGSEGTDTPDMSGMTRTQLPYTGEVSSVDKETEDRYNAAYKDYETQYLRLINNLPQDSLIQINDNIQASINENGETSPYYGLTPQDALIKYFNQNGGMSNSYFWDLPENATKAEKEELQTARQAYMDALRATSALAPEIRRIGEERKVYSSALRSAVQNYGGDTSALTNDAVSWLISRLAGTSLNTVIGLRTPAGDLQELIRTKGLSKEDIEDSQSVIDALDMGDMNLSKMFDYDPGTGLYRFNAEGKELSEDEAYLAGQIARVKNGEAVLDTEGMWRFNRLTDMDSIKEQIRAIRQQYLKEYAPYVLNISNNNQAKDYARTPGRQLASLYETKRQNAGLPVPEGITSWNIYRSGVGDNGQPQYTLAPSLTSEATKRSGENDPSDEMAKYAVTLSESDLVENGIPVDDAKNTLQLGDYDTARLPVSFASKNNQGYAEFLQSQGLDSRFADVDNAKKALHDMVTSLMPTNNSVGAISETAGRNILQTIDFIMDHANYFDIAEHGYDTSTGYSSGIETTLYVVSPNKRQSPSTVAVKVRVPSSGYADTRAIQFQSAPQVVFTQMISDMVADQLSWMAMGHDVIEETSDLYKIQEMLIDKIGTRDGNN